MSLNEKIMIDSLVRLDSSKLSSLEDNLIVSYSFKDEFIKEFSKGIEEIKNKGHKAMIFKETKCRQCFPNYKAYEFHDSYSDEFIVRYVIHQESENSIMVSKCSNQSNSWAEDLRSIEI